MAKTYEAMRKEGSSDMSGWQFLGLGNKKQAGDLEKKILHYRKKSSFTVFNFTCSRWGEGVSTVIANLVNYIKFQKSDIKILLIDANLQRPNLHNIFRLRQEKGLVEILEEVSTLSDSIQQIESTNINVLTSGKNSVRMANNIDQEKFTNLLEEAKKSYDLILVDSAPLLVTSDSISTAIAADVTFLIIQSLKVQREVGLRTKNLLIENECIIGGVVLNMVKQVIPPWVYRFT